MKIPYIIKFDNFKVRPLLVRDEFISYALRVILLNYEEIKAHQNETVSQRQFFYRSTDKSPKEKAFMKALYEQAFLNSVAKVIYTFEELKHLKTLVPKAYAPQFDNIQIRFEGNNYQPCKIKAGFSDMDVRLIDEIPYEKDNVIKSVFSRYLDIANSCQAMDKRGERFEDDLKLKAKETFENHPDLNFDPKFLEHMCSLVADSFNRFLSDYPFGSYQPDKAEDIRVKFVAQVQNSIKENLEIEAEVPNRQTFAYGIKDTSFVLHPTANIEPILWQALHDAYPSLAIQVEKQKLKSFEALKVSAVPDTPPKKKSTQKI